MSRANSTSAESDAFDDEGSEVKDAEQGANDKANVEHLDHTTRIAMRSGSVIPPPQSPKPAKPSACRSTTPTTPASSSSPPTSPPPDAPMATSIPMPGLANLTLHSPSATIVGTPFALDTDITRFEYPFPDTSLSPPGLYEYHNTSSSSSSGSGSGSGRLGVPALSHSSSSGSSGSSSSSASCTSSAAPSPWHPPSHAQQYQHHDPHHHQHVHIVSRHATHPIHIEHHPLSPTASALLADSDREEPPVPPGLLRKKHRWSLGLLAAPQRTREGTGGQRRSATADHARCGDKPAQNTDISNEYFDVSPGSESSSAASDAPHISDSDTLQGSDTEPSKLGEEEEVEGEAVDLTAHSALVG